VQAPPPSGQPYALPAYPPAYTPPPAIPAGAAAQKRRSIWPLLIAGLGLVLVCVCGVAFVTLTRAGTSGVAGIGAQIFNRVGEAFGPAPTATPTAPPVEPTQSSDPTQTANANKLLSPECSASLNQLSKVSDLVKNDPLKVLDDAWRKDLEQATTDMKTHCGSLDSASPIPGELGQVQKSMKQANTQFDQANQEWTQAIKQRDPGKALSAAQHIGNATKFLGEAISQLQKLTR
jgi:hypothetical protein